MNTLFACFVASLAVAQVALGDDPLAAAKCRSLHHVDVEPVGTQYMNQNCELDCNVHGTVYHHNMSEGLACPGLNATKNVCIGGKCVAPIKLGYIDIEMSSASLAKAVSAYADVCLQNSSTTVELPIVNRTTCVTCQTKVAPTSTNPIWGVVCTGSHNFQWVQESRVTFELWEQGSGKNTFGGGASLLITELLAHGDSHKSIQLSLARGDNSGKMTVMVTWTPK
ncbi:unnamed protein product [Oppiella nova]|uniref:C2 domain-containing protein n=1 Tax=Oppiella nova TaxID=334625 RepID=A0A7R9LPN7_9ACAR|nr:unnamed protein product [Oppiella nova]CAG2165735.1 unnamed protein product [Oppiella nova]